MALAFSDIVTAQTSTQIRATMVAELVALGIPADQWRSGGVASTMLTVTSIILAMMSSLIVALVQGFFLPTSTGAALRFVAFYTYGVTVPEATFATGNVTLTNSGGGSYTRAVGEYVAQNPTTKKTYKNAAAFSIGAGATISVAMVAVEAGSASNANPNTITQSVTPMLGVAVTNPIAFVGVDAPTDEAIRELCTAKLGAMSVRGVRTAYAYAIKVAINPVTLGSVNINRWAISESSHTGDVSLIVAAPSGSVDANDLIGIRTSVEANARPAGVAATASAATPVTYNPAIEVWVTPATGTNASDIQMAIETAVSAYIAAFPIGGVTASDDTHGSFTGLFGEAIIGAVAKGAATLGAELRSTRGVTDLALASSEVAVDGVTVSVNLVTTTGGVL